MNEFILDKDSWYKLRNDRTNRINGVSGYDDFSLGIVVDSSVESSFSTQIMTLITCNIVSRWCKNVKIQIPETVSQIPYKKGVNFRNCLQELMINIDPYGKFNFGHIEEKDFDQILVIGKTEKPFHKSVWINSSGWIAGAGYGSPQFALPSNEDDNPVGAAFASCLGMAEVFANAVSLTDPIPHTTWYSLYDYTRTNNNPAELKNPKYFSQFDYGRIYQIGCGAVGSSLDFLFSLTNWKSEIILIDHDTVDYPNCSCSLSFTPLDAQNTRRKIDVCGNILKSSNMSHVVFEGGSYDEYIKTGRYLDKPPDLILCLANEKNVWADIQYNFPPLVFHATTTPNWGINFGRHIPKKEWCIMCRFSEEIDHKFTPSCSEGVVNVQDNKEKQMLGVLPFLSPTGAVMILAEMAKMTLNDYPINKDFIELSMRPPGGISLQMRKAKLGCMCNQQILDFYPREIKNSKFWRLTK